MHSETGEIRRISEEEHAKFMEALQARNYEDNGRGKMIPLTEKQDKILTPMNAAERKGWMRNQLCICGSGKKFKRCCWSKL